MGGVVLCFASGSRNLRLAAGVIAIDWAASNFLFRFLAGESVNYIAPMNILVLGAFYAFWRSPTLNGAFIHRVFFLYYCLYLLLSLWHLFGRFFFPETLLATFYFAQVTANLVFIAVVSTLWLFGALKILDSRATGGLMGVYERNIEKWRRWFGER